MGSTFGMSGGVGRGRGVLAMPMLIKVVARRGRVVLAVPMFIKVVAGWRFFAPFGQETLIATATTFGVVWMFPAKGVIITFGGIGMVVTKPTRLTIRVTRMI